MKRIKYDVKATEHSAYFFLQGGELIFDFAFDPHFFILFGFIYLLYYQIFLVESLQSYDFI
jgi:hypothetical protein